MSGKLRTATCKNPSVDIEYQLSQLQATRNKIDRRASWLQCKSVKPNSFIKRLLRLALFWLVVVPGVPFVLGSAGILVYANWPGDSGLQEPTEWFPAAHKLTLVTHGKGDQAGGWVAKLTGLLRDRAGPAEQVIGIDWSRGASNVFRCSRNADVAGRQLAELVAEHSPVLTEVNFIAHSAGGFMAYGFCQQIKAIRPTIRVNITYLDPSGIYRGLWWNYGYRHFGSCADHSTTIYNVGDGVPGSEAPPIHGEALDISTLRPPEEQNGHMWPVHYFIQSLESEGTH